MIAAIEWVPAGVAKEMPLKYEMNPMDQFAMEEAMQQQDPTTLASKKKSSSNTTSKQQQQHHNLPPELRMDDYSDDDDEDDDGGAAIGNLLVRGDPVDDEPDYESPHDGDKEELEEEDLEGVGDKEMQEDGKDSQSDDDDDDDDDNLQDIPDTREFVPIDVEGLRSMGIGGDGGPPMIPLENYADDDSEAEDVRIVATDAVIVVAKTEEDFASLECHVYDTITGNLYIHHDIPLPSLPLCLAHGRIVGDNSSGNYCAVGTFDPAIEIWNLDVVNALEPSCILGGVDRTKSANGKGRSGPLLKPGSHTGAVMGLSWNQVHRHVIASGSADKTVKIWDVSVAGNDSSRANAGTFKHHKDKVQSVVWHPAEATILATGSYDRTVALVDARDSSERSIKTVNIPADCEALAWDPFRPENLTAACENGLVITWDVRKFVTKTPLWSLDASEFGVNDISYNRHVPGLMAAVSMDKTVSLWDVQDLDDNKTPRLCGRKEMKVGKLYTVSFYPSSPWLLGCGGSENQLALWDMSCEEAILRRFAKRVEGGEDYEVPEENKDQSIGEAIAEVRERKEAASDSHKKKKGKQKKKVHRKNR